MKDTNLMEALERINEIHGHMAKGEIYRGFQPKAIALSGSGGMLAAMLQTRVVNPADPRSFVLFWMCTAAICAIMAGPLLPFKVWALSPYERRRTLQVWGQFAPCLIAGGIVALGICYAMPESVKLLPGLWAIIFSLGIFSARPFLPRATGWIGVLYLVAGAWMLQNPMPISEPAWPLAITFFIGQYAGALVLHRNRERTFDNA